MHNEPMLQRPATSPGLAEAQRHMRQAWLAFVAVSVCLLAAVIFIAGDYGQKRAFAEIEERALDDVGLKAALLRAVLERQRAVPLVLSGDTELQRTLETEEVGAVDRLNRKLEALAASTRAAVIYVIDTDGMTIAASNWREPASFVGSNYGFRDYFRLGMKDGKAEHFAMGNVSRRPGLYISRRVDGAGGPLGVVVAKLEFDDVEAGWRASDSPAFVVDHRGIVLITSEPSWRFMTTEPIARERLAELRESLQFGDAPLLPLPFEKRGATDNGNALIRVLLPGGGTRDYLRVEAALPSTSWRIDQLSPVAASTNASIRETRLIALGALVPLLSLLAFLLRRRQLGELRALREQIAREELEARVIERTHDLSLARDRLQDEIAGHRQTSEKLQTVQEELVQANRLAILGQVAAGVAHEINQPVATIRAYADNARTFLDRGQMQTAAENMTTIASLTDRIGTITSELRSFARKGQLEAGPTDMRDVIEGAILLLRSRFSGRMDALDISLPANDLKVLGNRIRLEQVLINLLQNALEALGNRPDGRIEVTCAASETSEVKLSIADNGPGIPEQIREELFTPFNTSKAAGLGLGLAISKEIVVDYGGRIDVETGAEGTIFTIHLKKA
ncbi:ATP-binding protein [Rhizobiaceae bacterium n13]|uniref:C4-dicarboxylate transport sensor protein n=1 Tax=Ferirhizobium litorale TaxID=2927786 RepID=A0AAE3QBF8_9HYPH|nr:ATP-binding protein [Fererhizobium litorale]MDI7862031.1 ATP-binding protein [Fererhizobium litorale]MDI7922697.1 ATP-binding protein [Fererhizobium litorale]